MEKHRTEKHEANIESFLNEVSSELTALDGKIMGKSDFDDFLKSKVNELARKWTLAITETDPTTVKRKWPCEFKKVAVRITTTSEELSKNIWITAANIVINSGIQHSE